MQSLGFSNLIISNSVFNPDVVSYTTSLMKDYGFKRFFCAVSHDVCFTSPQIHIAKKKNIEEKIKKSAPRDTSLYVATNVLMTRDSVYEKQISRLSNIKTQYLFVEFPIFDGKDWIDSTLNYLLYKQKKNPVFISFEKNIATYDHDFILHLISTRCSAFMVDLNAFTNPKMIPYIEAMIDANAIIIPGMSGVVENYTSLSEKLNFFRENVGPLKYAKMVVNSNKSTKIVFGI